MPNRKSKPWFLLLLPLFFVWHGYTENFPAVPLTGALRLLAIYLAGTLVISALGYLLWKDFRKAAWLAFGWMCIYFFFGALQDQLQARLATLNRYSVLIPLTLLGAAAVFFFVHKTKFAWRKQAMFLNILLAALILLEAILLSTKFYKANNNASAFQPHCDTCIKPDIYLLLADEYAGAKALADQFGFDNTPFLDSLRKRKFYVVPASRSNYSFTIYSMASLFAMDYLPHLRNDAPDKESLTYAYGVIDENPVVDELKRMGYRVVNNSYFTFAGQAAHTAQSLLTNREGLINSQTLGARLWRHLGFHLVTTFKWKAAEEKITYTDLRNNEKLTDRLQQELTRKDTQPKMVYTHLMLPHYPYFKTRDGRRNPVDSIKEGTQGNMRLYLEYLHWANKEYLRLVDKILANQNRPTVIIFMSDHGFREYPPGVSTDYQFMNVNAVYGMDSSRYYTGFSNVNQFRLVFGELFGDKRPLLKDSTILQQNF